MYIQMYFAIVHFNKHDFFHLANTNSKGHQFLMSSVYTNSIAVALFDLFLVKELLTFTIRYDTMDDIYVRLKSSE